MSQKPDHTAVRTALWRALHVELDAKPYVFADTVGAALVGEENWRARPDMGAEFSKPMRASIVARARFVEDLLLEKKPTQYVLLGAGLDTFAQRRPELAAHMHIFEIDQPGTQAWKRKRLSELNLPMPSSLHFVPVDFEAGESWWDKLKRAGFDKAKSALVVSTGVSMYLSDETNLATLKQLTELAPDSVFAMTFMLPPELLHGQEKASMEYVMKKAAEAKTPFLSLFSPQKILKMAEEAGFKKSRCVSAADLHSQYLAGRADGLNAGSAENFLLAEI